MLLVIYNDLLKKNNLRFLYIIDIVIHTIINI